MRIALLTNGIPSYRPSLFAAIRGLVDDLRVFVSEPVPESLVIQGERAGYQIVKQRALILPDVHRHPRGFSEAQSIHVPYDTIGQLGAYKPDVVISAEMGARTLLALFYCRVVRRTPLAVWATLSEETERGRGVTRSVLRRMLARHANAFLVNGKGGARYIRRLVTGNPRVMTVPYTTEMTPFLSLSLDRQPADDHRLLYVGQLAERKGVQLFLPVLSGWVSQHEGEKSQFWLAGEGEYRTSLESLARSSRLSTRFLGPVPYQELPDVYAQAGILVFPSLADEWGVVVNEALGSGLPVLGSVYSQAVDELIDEGITGWKFHPDDSRDTYAAIDRALLVSHDRLTKMRMAARERVACLTPAKVAEAFVRAIETVTL